MRDFLQTVYYEKGQLSYALANAIKERDEAREVLREIAAADWKTSGELRGMARKALEEAK